MPSMITTCPKCSRKGIMKKSTGVCVRCSNGGSAPAKKTAVAVPVVAVVAVPVTRETKKRTKSARCVAGRLAR